MLIYPTGTISFFLYILRLRLFHWYCRSSFNTWVKTSWEAFKRSIQVYANLELCKQVKYWPSRCKFWYFKLNEINIFSWSKGDFDTWRRQLKLICWIMSEKQNTFSPVMLDWRLSVSWASAGERNLGAFTPRSPHRSSFWGDADPDLLGWVSSSLVIAILPKSWLHRPAGGSGSRWLAQCPVILWSGLHSRLRMRRFIHHTQTIAPGGPDAMDKNPTNKTKPKAGYCWCHCCNMSLCIMPVCNLLTRSHVLVLNQG